MAMKIPKIVWAMAHVDEAYLEEAMDRGDRSWQRWAALAACLALVIGLTAALWPKASPLPELPSLTISRSQGGSGYEGYSVMDISELTTGNPWQQVQGDTLPVYRNVLSWTAHHELSGDDPAAIKAFLLELAGRLGLTEADLEISDDRDEHDPPREWGMRAEGGNASFLVYMDRDAQVLFTPDEPLPDSIRSLDESSYEAMEQAAAWFVETYANLLDMEDPQICIEGGSYNIYAVQRYSIRIYDRGATAEESTMNYFFRYVMVALNHDDGEILLRYQDTDLSQKLGDYPIISEKEARKMLKNGNSITSTGYTLTGKEEIGRVDIVYRVGPYTVDYLPYYRFLVELPQEHFGHNNGTKTYGAYYVPAVNMAYLPDVTLWNGTFNQ